MYTDRGVQTEIPALQIHCKKLTENGRQAACRRFLNATSQLFTSLGFWASDDGTGTTLTTTQRDVERSFSSKRLKELEKALVQAVDAIINDIGDTLVEHVFDKYKPAVKAAAESAIPTSAGWGMFRCNAAPMAFG